MIGWVQELEVNTPQLRGQCVDYIQNLRGAMDHAIANLQGSSARIRAMLDALRSIWSGCPLSKACRDRLKEYMTGLLNALRQIEQWLAQLQEWRDNLDTSLDRCYGDLAWRPWDEYEDRQFEGSHGLPPLMRPLRTQANSFVASAFETVAAWEAAVAAFTKACACPNPLIPVKPVYTAA